MKKIYCFLFSALLCSSLFAQSKDSVVCPKIKIKALKNSAIQLNTETTFYSFGIKKNKNIEDSISYNWTVFNGRIIGKKDGKNAQIIAAAAEGEGQQMLVTLEVTGLDKKCPSTAIVNLDIAPVQIMRTEEKLVGVPAGTLPRSNAETSPVRQN